MTNTLFTSWYNTQALIVFLPLLKNSVLIRPLNLGAFTTLRDGSSDFIFFLVRVLDSEALNEAARVFFEDLRDEASSVLKKLR